MEKQRTPRKELMPIFPTQLKVVTLVCLPLVLGCIIVSILQTYFFLTSLQSQEALSTELAHEVMSSSVLITAITLFVMVPLFILGSVWVSYRILGPLRRLARELKSIGQGQLEGGFYLRKGDELVFVALDYPHFSTPSRFLSALR